MTELPDAIFRHWIHSYEEDKGSTKVYRPLGYKFPPSRGRRGFEIEKNGSFILYDIGPTDQSSKTIGNWHLSGPNKIKIDFEDPRHESWTLNILSLEENLLSIYLDH